MRADLVDLEDNNLCTIDVTKSIAVKLCSYDPRLFMQLRDYTFCAEPSHSEAHLANLDSPPEAHQGDSARKQNTYICSPFRSQQIAGLKKGTLCSSGNKYT